MQKDLSIIKQKNNLSWGESLAYAKQLMTLLPSKCSQQDFLHFTYISVDFKLSCFTMSQSWSSLETFKQCVCTCGALFILPTYSQIYLEFMPSMLDCMWKERERVTMLLLSNEIYTKRFSFVLIVVLVSLPLPIITFNKSWELNHSTAFLYTTGLCKKKKRVPEDH